MAANISQQKIFTINRVKNNKINPLHLKKSRKHLFSEIFQQTCQKEDRQTIKKEIDNYTNRKLDNYTNRKLDIRQLHK